MPKQYEAFVDEFIKLSIEDLYEAGDPQTPENQIQVLTDWAEIYEDVPPRNRAETRVRDALLEAIDKLKQKHNLHQHA